jgi:putative endonuclease
LDFTKINVQMKKGGAVYILTNHRNTTLYTGVTSDIIKRLYQHRNGVYKYNFTSKYSVTKLVYYEVFLNIEDAIAREKQIKGGSRMKKENLILSTNPNWLDLSMEVGVE